MRTPALLLAIAALACGGGDAPRSGGTPRARRLTLPATIDATPAGPGDLVIARVDGRPVYASCVQAQAAHARTIRAALDECIAFELLAGAAAARGLAADPAVEDEVREAMVNRLVELEFDGKVRSAADLPPQMVTDAVEARGPRLQQPPRRTGVYVRATLPKTTPAGAPEEVAARQLIEAVHAELADRKDLFPADVFAVGQRVAAERGGKVDFDENPYPTAIDGGADKAWRAAIWAIPAIGMVSPPIRTAYGWEIVLWVGSLPATNTTRDELLATLFPDLRRKYFPFWTNRFAKGMSVARDPGAEKALQSLEGP
jgi:hypothetical protein